MTACVYSFYVAFGVALAILFGSCTGCAAGLSNEDWKKILEFQRGQKLIDTTEAHP